MNFADICDHFVCASTGNHALGAIYVCRQLGKKLTIFVPESIPNKKLDVINAEIKDDHDIKIIKFGNIFNDSLKQALLFAEKSNARFVHPYDSEYIVNGQSTIMNEVYEQMNKSVDYIFVPVGGGGLISGITKYIIENKLKTKIISCQSDINPTLSLSKSNRQNTIVEIDKNILKIADGTCVDKIGEHNWNILNKFNNIDCVNLNHEQIMFSIGLCINELKINTEGAAALSLAGFLKYYLLHKNDLNGKKICLINSGSRMDNDLQNRCIDMYKNSPDNLFSLYE